MGNLPHERNAGILEHVIDQFDVENAVRYRADAARTWCKTFVWDVTRALFCEVPHWIDVDGEPATPGGGHRETTANVITQWWMPEHGRRRGWTPASAALAQVAADAGAPALACWWNPQGPGHVAVLRPSRGEPGVWIAQAGRKNHRRCTLGTGFGRHSVECWVHE